MEKKTFKALVAERAQEIAAERRQEKEVVDFRTTTKRAKEEVMDTIYHEYSELMATPHASKLEVMHYLMGKYECSITLIYTIRRKYEKETTL